MNGLVGSWLPKRVKACPVCGDRDAVQLVVWGMPYGRPPEHEVDRIHFAGCVIAVEVDGNGDVIREPKWRCPADDHMYR